MGELAGVLSHISNCGRCGIPGFVGTRGVEYPGGFLFAKNRVLGLPEAGQMGQDSLLVEAGVAVAGQELGAVFVVHGPLR